MINKIKKWLGIKSKLYTREQDPCWKLMDCNWNGLPNLGQAKVYYHTKYIEKESNYFTCWVLYTFEYGGFQFVEKVRYFPDSLKYELLNGYEQSLTESVKYDTRQLGISDIIPASSGYRLMNAIKEEIYD